MIFLNLFPSKRIRIGITPNVFKLKERHHVPISNSFHPDRQCHGKTLKEGSLKKYGFVPNLHGGLTEAPAALIAYIELTALV